MSKNKQILLLFIPLIVCAAAGWVGSRAHYAPKYYGLIPEAYLRQVNIMFHSRFFKDMTCPDWQQAADDIERAAKLSATNEGWYEWQLGMAHIAYQNMILSHELGEQAIVSNRCAILKEFLAIESDVPWGKDYRSVESIKEGIQQHPDLFPGITVPPYERVIW